MGCDGAVLKIDQIEVCYDDFHVIDKVSLNIKLGECVALLGGNGAGKSTLINAISGILPVNGGMISFNEVKISSLPSYKIVDMGIIQVPEGRRLFPAMTVRENLLLGAYCPRAKGQRQEKMDEILALLPDLGDKLNRMAGSLSGGEQQMCAMGRGLMALPTILMLDEPSLGLAPLMVERIFEIIKQVNKMGTAVLLVEQNVELSLEVSERAYVLENGRIRMEGAAHLLKDNEELKKAYLGGESRKREDIRQAPPQTGRE